MGESAPVLVVEDDPSLRLLYRVNLELEQFEVHEAATLEEARAAMSRERPGVVVLDVHLEGVPSDAFLDELRAARIPVVLVTGTADIDRYRDRADDVLASPSRRTLWWLRRSATHVR